MLKFEIWSIDIRLLENLIGYSQILKTCYKKNVEFQTQMILFTTLFRRVYQYHYIGYVQNKNNLFN